MMWKQAPQQRIQARKIGFLADTHCHGDGLPEPVLASLVGVDLIVHLGDMGEAETLDQLETIAPVLATRGMDDPRKDPRMVRGARLLDAGDTCIGAVFDLPALGAGLGVEGKLRLPAKPLSAVLAKAFGRPVVVVAFGKTHYPLVETHEGVLFLNPGSATMPAEGAPATIALLELGQREPVARIVEL